MKKLLVTLLLVLPLTLFSQRDSLNQVIANTKSDTVKMYTYIAIADLFYQVKPDSCKFYVQKSYDYAQKLNDRTMIPYCENYIGLCGFHQENYETALKWYLMALDGFIENGQERSTLMTLNNIGAAYSEMQQPVKATPYLLRAKEYAEKGEHTDVLLLTEMNLGNVYGDLGQDSLSEHYFRMSRSRITPEIDPYNYAMNTYNIANLMFTNKRDFKEARKLLHESNSLSTKHGYSNLSMMTANNLASYYLTENNFLLDSAFYWANKCRAAADDLENYNTDIYVFILYGDLYRQAGMLDSSLYVLSQGEKIWPFVQEDEAKYKLNFELAKTYEKLQNYEKAYQYYKSGSELQRKLYNTKNTQIFADLRANHEVEVRDQEIALTRKDNAIKDQKLQSNQNRIRYFIIGTILLLGLLGFIVYFLIQKNRHNKLLREQNILIEEQRQSIEEKQNEILDSINYASRIQSAILPKNEILLAQLKNGFVLYLPKDVVSGDFYWMHQISVGHFIVAVADCTGHGVPGAMVSVICNNALNRCVREFGLTDPGLILDKTREIVIQEFDESDENVRDGMDISICNVNYNSKKMLWAGANNPIWILNKNEFKELKGDKMPVGRYEHTTSFQTHEIELRQGERYILFSDGFADQFGGKKGKKYKYRALKEFLIDLSEEPIERFEQLLKAEFLRWKEDYEQLDDVCFVGFTLPTEV